MIVHFLQSSNEIPIPLCVSIFTYGCIKINTWGICIKLLKVAKRNRVGNHPKGVYIKKHHDLKKKEKATASHLSTSIIWLQLITFK